MTQRNTKLSLWFRGCLLAVLAVAAVVLTGCATPDDEGSSRDRPWNEPQGWEHGMPPGFEQGRR
jgi:hypothetical protein